MSSGTDGLDAVLNGGLVRNRMYMVQGEPGSGKTTLALQFLLEGRRREERGLYITLSESRDDLHAVARSHGWLLEEIDVYELSVAVPTGELVDEENTLYVPAEVELSERLMALVAEVERVKPQRIVLDSCSELRLLAQSPLRFRRQLLGLKSELLRRGCTVLLLDNNSKGGELGNDLIQSLVHGVINLEQLSPDYGAERRRLRVLKLREVAFRGGFHDFVIRHAGVEVFPRLVASEHQDDYPTESVSSGLPELDKLLGGGPERGSSMLIVGPAGTGKSALTTRYVVSAAMRGEHAAVFAFDEGKRTLETRAAGLGMDLKQYVDRELVSLQQVDPAELAPGEFVDAVRRAVEQDGARVLVIDSLNGYLHAMPQEQYLLAHMHELLSYLRQRGVLTLLVVAQHGLLGSMDAPVDLSYLADTVLVTRYFEARGHVRKSLSVIKKRTGGHEATIRELGFGESGIQVGPPLTQFHGVLTGVPIYEGQDKRLLGGSSE